jgi:hypothetical protein
MIGQVGYWDPKRSKNFFINRWIRLEEAVHFESPFWETSSRPEIQKKSQQKGFLPSPGLLLFILRLFGVLKI